MTQTMTPQEVLDQGIQRHLAGNLQEAEGLYRQVLSQQPDHPDALHLLGMIASQVGRQDAAIGLISRAIQLRPSSADFYQNLGGAYHLQGRLDQAVSAYRKALEINPSCWQAWMNMGNAFRKMGHPTQAVSACKQALLINPNSVAAMDNLGSALFSAGELDQALIQYKMAIDRQPDFADAHWNASHILLMCGDYENGWPQYEWRWRVPRLEMRENESAPRWDGADLNGKSILVYNDQALGDALQFFRYIALIADRGGKITIAAQAELRRLLAMQSGVERCVEPHGPISPPCDFQISMGSLAGIFATTLNTIPTKVPYIVAGAAEAGKWKSRVDAAAGGKRKIGLVWAGKDYDPFRSVPAEVMAPLASTGNAWFCSLQKGNPAPAPNLPLTDWTGELNDLADTAALMANLDLVITIDTAVAHLAGAMGLPAWVLLKSVPDWRWMAGRGDSPWYPSLRLFRQPPSRDWSVPMSEIAAGLNNVENVAANV